MQSTLTLLWEITRAQSFKETSILSDMILGNDKEEILQAIYKEMLKNSQPDQEALLKINLMLDHLVGFWEVDRDKNFSAPPGTQ